MKVRACDLGPVHEKSRARRGACPCGGWGRHFSRAGETVARSTDVHAAVPILVSGDTVKRKNSIAAFGNQALTVPPFYRMPRSICRSISKISSDLGARFCGGSRSAKGLAWHSQQNSSLSTRERRGGPVHVGGDRKRVV